VKFTKTKIHTLIEYQLKPDGFELIRDEAYWYNGPIAQVGGQPTIEQTDWAVYSDGTESGSAIIGTKNNNQTLNVDTIYLFRGGIEETANNLAPNVSFATAYNHNGGGFNDVDDVSSVVQIVDSTNITDGDDTTQRLTSFTFITDNNGYDDVDGVTNAITMQNNGFEGLWAFQIIGTDVSNNDTIVIKLVDDKGDDLDVYNQTDLTITVSKGVDTSVDATSVALTVATNQATVNAETNVQANTQALIITGQIATVSLTLDVNVSANSVPLVITPHNPTVKADKEILIGTTALTIATYSPTVNAATNAQANTQALTITSYQATVNAETNAQANTVGLTITTYPADIPTDVSVDATSVALTIATYQATVDGAGITDYDLTGTRIQNATRVNQALEDADVTDWDANDDFILCAMFETVEAGGASSIIQVQWRNVTDAGSFANLGNTGELTYNGVTDLVTSDPVTVGESVCTPISGTTYQNGIEIEGFGTAFKALTQNDYTEHQWAIGASNALANKQYEFRFFDNDNNVAIGTALADITMASGVNVLANTAALTITTYTVTVNAKTQVDANTQALTITPYSATVTANIDVQANSVALTITPYSPTVNAETSLQATSVALTIATYQATISAAAAGDISANTAALTITTYSATIEGGAVVEEPVRSSGGNYRILPPLPPEKKKRKLTQVPEQVPDKVVKLREVPTFEPKPKLKAITDDLAQSVAKLTQVQEQRGTLKLKRKAVLNKREQQKLVAVLEREEAARQAEIQDEEDLIAILAMQRMLG